MRSDIPAIAGAFSGINIKLMKAGGMLEALRMFQVAKAFNLDTMLGCMIETSIAITAGAQLQSLARWVDLDGNLLLSDDPFAGRGTERRPLATDATVPDWASNPGSNGAEPGNTTSSHFYPYATHQSLCSSGTGADRQAC